jgi:hypothetical protein
MPRKQKGDFEHIAGRGKKKTQNKINTYEEGKVRPMGKEMGQLLG